MITSALSGTAIGRRRRKTLAILHGPLNPRGSTVTASGVAQHLGCGNGDDWAIRLSQAIAGDLPRSDGGQVSAPSAADDQQIMGVLSSRDQNRPRLPAEGLAAEGDA